MIWLMSASFGAAMALDAEERERDTEFAGTARRMFWLDGDIVPFVAHFIYWFSNSHQLFCAALLENECRFLWFSLPHGKKEDHYKYNI